MGVLNEHIDQFLKYYCSSPSPEYAVMLKGKWGSGKTFYIDRFKKYLDEKSQKYVYVSLYGVTAYEEIEDKFFEQLHPTLSNKKMILGAKIFKDLLRSTLKKGIEPDSDIDIVHNIDSFPSYLTDTQKHILIFDDLERCSIPVNDLLGYINNFVEHQGYRVIIVANEDELNKEDKEYHTVKEKLIGKIFELKSNVDAAYDSFIKNIDDRAIFEQNSEMIKEVYLASGYDNLRFLRQTILDFSRFYSYVLKEHNSKIELIRDVMKLYFILSFENRNSDFDIFKIDKYYNEYINLDEDEQNTQSKYSLLVNKYRFDFYYSKIFNLQTWDNVLNSSIIDYELIQKAIKSSKYYSDERTPNWKKLWHFNNLNDEEFKQLIEVVEYELKENRLNNVYEVMHVSCILLYMSHIGLYKHSNSDVLFSSKEHINYLFENKKVDAKLYENPQQVMEKIGHEGLEFKYRENRIFKILLRHIETKLRQEEKEILHDYVESIIDMIGVDDDVVYAKLSSDDENENKYFNVPLLSFMDSERICKKIISVKSESQQSFGFILERRYKDNIKNEQLVSEIKFLYALRYDLKQEHKILDGKLSGYNLKQFIDGPLNVAIQELQKYVDKIGYVI